MARNSTQENTRQIFASVREDLYLAAKARAAELRIPLREFVELALDLTLSGQVVSEAEERKEPSVWDDEYLGMQAEQPVGSPVELTKEEAKRVAMAAFGASPSDCRTLGGEASLRCRTLGGGASLHCRTLGGGASPR